MQSNQRSNARTAFGFQSELDESKTNLQSLHTNVYINDENSEPLFFNNQIVKG